MKKHYYLVLDVETANSTQDALVYDIGMAVTDRQGKIYEKHSFINKDIFFNESELMQSAYYAKKIPTYLENIKRKETQVSNYFTIRQTLLNLIKKYNIKFVCAYNAHFDITALNTTLRWETKSKYRYFLPKEIEIIDIWNMACQSICSQKKYYKFCVNNNLISNSGNISTSAESVYKFLKQDVDFQEKHKGLDDVLIETEIMVECYKKKVKLNKNINRSCWRLPQQKGK